MDEIREFFSRIKLVRMRTPNLVKVILILVIVFCMVTLIGLRIAIHELEDRTEKLTDEAAVLSSANEELKDKIDDGGTLQAVIDIAREVLGLVEPGSVIIETGSAPATDSSEGN